jgi:serine/threonine protein kinase
MNNQANYQLFHREIGSANPNQIIGVVLEYVNHNLEDELLKRRARQSPFTEPEIWFLAFSVITAARTLQDKSICHGNICPRTLLLNAEGRLKLCDNSIVHSQPFDIETMKRQRGYFSPQILQNLALGKWTGQQNFFKSDVFSFGLTLIEATTLADVSQIVYDWQTFTIKHQAIQHLIRQLDGRYSENLIKLISSCLYLDERIRPDWVDLDIKFQGKQYYDKTVQNASKPAPQQQLRKEGTLAMTSPQNQAPKPQEYAIPQQVPPPQQPATAYYYPYPTAYYTSPQRQPQPLPPQQQQQQQVVYAYPQQPLQYYQSPAPQQAYPQAQPTQAVAVPPPVYQAYTYEQASALQYPQPQQNAAVAAPPPAAPPVAAQQQLASQRSPIHAPQYQGKENAYQYATNYQSNPAPTYRTGWQTRAGEQYFDPAQYASAAEIKMISPQNQPQRLMQKSGSQQHYQSLVGPETAHVKNRHGSAYATANTNTNGYYQLQQYASYQ